MSYTLAFEVLFVYRNSLNKIRDFDRDYGRDVTVVWSISMLNGPFVCKELDEKSRNITDCNLLVLTALTPRCYRCIYIAHSRFIIETL